MDANFPSNLTSIGFNATNTDAQDKAFKIYLCDTDVTALTDDYRKSLSYEDLTLVYEATRDNKYRFQAGWNDFAFDTPYEHDTSKNLLVIVENDTGSFNNGCSYFSVYSEANGNTVGINYYTDSSFTGFNSNSSGTPRSYKNVVRFGGDEPTWTVTSGNYELTLKTSNRFTVEKKALTAGMFTTEDLIFNGNEQTVPDEEVALAIIDCGGTLRCGIYPGKGIPTVNLLATGRSGPLAKYMTEDLYVSAVTSAQVSPTGEAAPAHSPQKAARNPFIPFAKGAPQGLFSQDTEGDSSAPAAMQASPGPAELPQEAAAQASSGSAELPQEAAARRLRGLLRPAAAVSKVISIFHQSARDAVRTCLDSLLPFMGFAALFIGICRGSGLTEFLASGLQPMGGSLPGLMGLGIICSIPGLSAVLGAGAVAAQMFSTVIGDLIAAGTISPAMALPALFAINTQCACDFIPVGLSMTEAAPDTTQVGMTSVTLSRFATGWIRILIALVFSIGLYR